MKISGTITGLNEANEMVARMFAEFRVQMVPGRFRAAFNDSEEFGKLTPEIAYSNYCDQWINREIFENLFFALYQHIDKALPEIRGVKASQKITKFLEQNGLATLVLSSNREFDLECEIGQGEKGRLDRPNSGLHELSRNFLLNPKHTKTIHKPKNIKKDYLFLSASAAVSKIFLKDCSEVQSDKENTMQIIQNFHYAYDNLAEHNLFFPIFCTKIYRDKFTLKGSYVSTFIGRSDPKQRWLYFQFLIKKTFFSEVKKVIKDFFQNKSSYFMLKKNKPLEKLHWILVQFLLKEGRSENTLEALHKEYEKFYPEYVNTVRFHYDQLQKRIIQASQGTS